MDAYKACIQKRTVVNFIAVDYFEKEARYTVEAALHNNGARKSLTDPPSAPSTGKIIRNWFKSWGWGRKRSFD